MKTFRSARTFQGKRGVNYLHELTASQFLSVLPRVYRFVLGGHGKPGFSPSYRSLKISSSAFVPAGNYNYSNGALNNVGERQLYWSSTANTTETNAWNLNFNSGTVYPGTNNNKGNGFSVRCVAR